MPLNIIGQLSLSISCFVYIICFLPQVWHNRNRENARELSYGLQLLYVMSYSSDWLYGAAANLEWQYRFTTLVGLLALCYQQWQMRPSRKDAQLPHYLSVSLLVVLLIGGSQLLGALIPSSQLPVTVLGILSTFGAAVATLPQIVTNFKHKNGQAISHGFIVTAVFCCILDMISAFSFNWPWPSFVSPPLACALLCFCWGQQTFYRKHHQRRLYPIELSSDGFEKFSSNDDTKLPDIGVAI
jgi:uncharacterized protein with PQ loop repeat